MSHSRILCGLLLAAALCAGCGPEDSRPATSVVTAPGSAPETGVEMPDDVCALISAGDLGAITGGTQELSTAPVHSCDFSQADDPRARRGGFGLLANTAEGTYETYVYGMKASLTDPDVTEPTGIGTRATIVVGSGPMSESRTAAAVAEVGDLLVTLNLLGGDAATLEQQSQEILKALVAGVD